VKNLTPNMTLFTLKPCVTLNTLRDPVEASQDQ
jgi:hypothetical protein